MLTNFPGPVTEVLTKAIEVLSEPGGFFEDYNVPADRGSDLFAELAGPAMLKAWLENGEIEIPNDDDFHAYLTRIATESHLMDLKEAGLVDSIDDEDGQEHFWLTNEGKEIYNIAKHFEKK